MTTLKGYYDVSFATIHIYRRLIRLHGTGAPDNGRARAESGRIKALASATEWLERAQEDKLQHC